MSLTWLAILKGTTENSARDLLTGPEFEDDPWTKRYRASTPKNVKDWDASMLMSGAQYNSDTQELYNHLVGKFKGDPLTIARTYLNGGKRALRVLLRKYMNNEQQHLMSRATRNNFLPLSF